ncbi:MAG: MATE family efflux transporter [Brevinema sp.]
MPSTDLELEIEENVPPPIPKSVLDNDHVASLILKLSFPMMVGALIDALYNTVDSIFVGHYVGPEALAALTVNFTIQVTLMAIAATISVGTGVTISRALGEKKYYLVKEGLINGMWLGLLLSVMLAWCLLFNLDNILLFIGSDQSFLSYTRDYGRIILWVAFVPVMNGIISAILRAKGHSQMSMWILAIGASLNILLDAIFIAGFKWGVTGAALATVISQITVCFVGFTLIFHSYKISFRDFITTKIRPELMKEICIIGLAPGLRQASFSIMNFISNKTLGGFGTTALAAYGLTFRMVNLAFMPIFGCNMGSQPVISFNYGARRYDRIVVALKSSIFIVTIIGALGNILFLWSPLWLIQMFTSDQPTILQATDAMRKSGMLFFLFGAQMIISSLIQSTGFNRLSLFMAISRPLISICGFIFLPMFIGLDGIWFTQPISDFVCTVIALLALLYVMPRLKKQLEHQGSIPL